ncbi:MAG: SBBP repeat-containing protein [Chloroflexi bacterium]|nr:SBBP repeat-containing protein [Chloroflexota bacterium]
MSTAAGNAYVTGYTDPADFPTTAGAFERTYNGGGNDAFVAKLSADGSALVYGTYLGGSGQDVANAIAVDAAGNAYVAGWAISADFPTTAGAFDRTYGGSGGDAFVVKLDTTGSALAYATYLGGSSQDDSSGIAVDAAGSAYVTGRTRSPDFPTTAGAFDRTHNGNDDVFVAKLDATGSALVYATYLGGSSQDDSSGIAVDAAGSAYVAGSTLSTDFPTTAGAFDQTYNGGGEAFVAKLNATGSTLVYATYMGGSESDQATGIAVDVATNAYVTGGTNTADSPGGTASWLSSTSAATRSSTAPTSAGAAGTGPWPSPWTPPAAPTSPASRNLPISRRRPGPSTGR